MPERTAALAPFHNVVGWLMLIIELAALVHLGVMAMGRRQAYLPGGKLALPSSA